MERGLTGAEAAELGSLQNAVLQIEGTLRVVPDAFTLALLERFLANAKNRIAELGQVQKEREAKADAAERSEQGIAAMVERERLLNEAEKREYGELLEHEYFTKAEFGKLEKFYTNSWDKLTDDGKNAMSERVWGGVHHGHYRFSELPEVVKEKEAQWVELGFKRGGNVGLEAVPENDRSDFMQARATGQRERSFEILERPSFTQNVAKVPNRECIENSNDEKKETLEEQHNRGRRQPAPEQVAVHESMDSNHMSLREMQELDGAASILAAPLPERKGALAPKVRQ